MLNIKSCICVGLGNLIRSAFGRTRSIGGSVRDILTLAIYLLKIEFIAAGDWGGLGRGSLVRLVRLIVRSVRGGGAQNSPLIGYETEQQDVQVQLSMMTQRTIVPW
jgi:hypothetical protein